METPVPIPNTEVKLAMFMPVLFERKGKYKAVFIFIFIRIKEPENPRVFWTNIFYNMTQYKIPAAGQNDTQKRFKHASEAYTFYVNSVLKNPDKKVLIKKHEHGSTIEITLTQLGQDAIRAAEPLDVLGPLSIEQLSVLESR